MTPKMSFSDRITKASEVLNVSPKMLEECLKDEGILESSGLKILDAETTSLEDLINLMSCLKRSDGLFPSTLQKKTAAGILKSTNIVKEQTFPSTTPKISIPTESGFEILAKALKPIQQWTDLELLEKFDSERDIESEQELNRRAKGQNFIVLRYCNTGTIKECVGNEKIDIPNTLELLKNSRRRTNPSIIPSGDGHYLQVYKITELNMNDRIVDICPICGETLWKSFCEHCNVMLDGIDSNTLSFMKLVSDSTKFNKRSFSDVKALVISAKQGLDDLKKTWPGVVKRFEELELIGDLPKLRIIRTRPTSISDPFFQDGNRFFGNRTI